MKWIYRVEHRHLENRSIVPENLRWRCEKEVCGIQKLWHPSKTLTSMVISQTLPHAARRVWGPHYNSMVCAPHITLHATDVSADQCNIQLKAASNHFFMHSKISQGACPQTPPYGGFWLLEPSVHMSVEDSVAIPHVCKLTGIVQDYDWAFNAALINAKWIFLANYVWVAVFY